MSFKATVPAARRHGTQPAKLHDQGKFLKPPHLGDTEQEVLSPYCGTSLQTNCLENSMKKAPLQQETKMILVLQKTGNFQEKSQRYCKHLRKLYMTSVTENSCLSIQIKWQQHLNRKKNLRCLKEIKIQLSSEIKYLGLILDKGLAWRTQLDRTMNKALLDLLSKLLLLSKHYYNVQ